MHPLSNLSGWYRHGIDSGLVRLIALLVDPVSGERKRRKEMAVQMVVDVKITREPRAGVLRLVPRAVDLRVPKKAKATLAGRVGASPGQLKRENGPRGLGGGAPPESGKRRIMIRIARFTPSAIGILYGEHPGRRALDHRRPRA